MWNVTYPWGMLTRRRCGVQQSRWDLIIMSKAKSFKTQYTCLRPYIWRSLGNIVRHPSLAILTAVAVSPRPSQFREWLTEPNEPAPSDVFNLCPSLAI